MASDAKLQRDPLDVVIRADHRKWIHQTTWLGEPILNISHDMFALQEISYHTRPEYFIQVGVE